MGWMRTLFLGDIGNRLDIADTERDIDQIRGHLRSTVGYEQNVDAAQDERLAFLERENEQLELAVAALARRLVSKGVLAESDLEAIVNRLDA